MPGLNDRVARERERERVGKVVFVASFSHSVSQSLCLCVSREKFFFHNEATHNRTISQQRYYLFARRLIIIIIIIISLMEQNKLSLATTKPRRYLLIPTNYQRPRFPTLMQFVFSSFSPFSYSDFTFRLVVRYVFTFVRFRQLRPSIKRSTARLK